VYLECLEYIFWHWKLC